MRYDLGLKLKNAGFPQRHMPDGNEEKYYVKLGYPIYICPHGSRECNTYACPEKVYLPQIIEIIEAIGEDFCSLTQQISEDKPIWSADTRSTFQYEEAETPEEALVNLFLSLQKT